MSAAWPTSWWSRGLDWEVTYRVVESTSRGAWIWLSKKKNLKAENTPEILSSSKPLKIENVGGLWVAVSISGYRST